MDEKVRAELMALGEGSPTVADERRLLRALFFGPFGSGKSTTALKCIEKKGIWITSDSAWVVIDKYPELRPLVHRYPFEGFSQIRSFCEAKDEGIEPWATADTLIWDTVAGSIDSTLYTLLNNSRMKFKDQRHEDVPSWTHYGIIQRKLRQTVDVLSRSQFNVIYIAHDREPTEADREKQKFAVRANMPEASWNIIAREVQLIGCLFKEDRGQKKKITFEGTIRQQAKSQIPTINETQYNLEQVPELIQKWKMQ